MNDKQCGKKRQLGCGALGGADGEGTHNYVIFADEDIEIADLLFQPDDDTESADNGSMGEEQRREITEKLETMAVPMDSVEFSRENYDKLFPNSRIETPLGVVKLGEHQFEKLQARERTELLGALKQTLEDPILVVSSEGAELYTKSFIEDDKTKAVISVVIKKDGQSISISTHRRDLENIINKIKKDNILYEKDIVNYNAGRTHSSKKRDNASAEATPNTGSGGGSLKTGDQNQTSLLSSNSTDKSSGDFPEDGEGSSIYLQTREERTREESARYASPELWRKAVENDPEWAEFLEGEFGHWEDRSNSSFSLLVGGG